MYDKMDGYVGETNESNAPIDQPGEYPEKGGDTKTNCPYGGQMWRPGTIICMNGRDHKCKSNGRGTALGTHDSC